jgi:hypothetical protein
MNRLKQNPPDSFRFLDSLFLEDSLLSTIVMVLTGIMY